MASVMAHGMIQHVLIKHTKTAGGQEFTRTLALMTDGCVLHKTNLKGVRHTWKLKKAKGTHTAVDERWTPEYLHKHINKEGYREVRI